MIAPDISAAFDAAEAALSASDAPEAALAVFDAAIGDAPVDGLVITADDAVDAALETAAAETAIAADVMDDDSVVDAINAAIDAANNNLMAESAMEAAVASTEALENDAESAITVTIANTTSATHPPDEPAIDDESVQAVPTEVPDSASLEDRHPTTSPQRRSRSRTPSAKADSLQSASPSSGRRKRSHSRSFSSSSRKRSGSQKARSEPRTPIAASDTHGNIIAVAEAASVDRIPEPQEVQDSSKFYWEVEKVLARRKKRGRLEYLIKWKNCPESQNTWEPTANLCDTALEDAKKLDKEEKEREKAMALEESKLGLIDLTSTPVEIEDVDMVDAVEDKVEEEVDIVEMPPVVDEMERQWRWNDAEQVHLREVVRIHVYDVDARDKVTEARMNGIPIVLIGHKGWANFAKRWLKQASTAEEGVTIGDNNIEGETHLAMNTPEKGLDLERIAGNTFDENEAVTAMEIEEGIEAKMIIGAVLEDEDPFQKKVDMAVTPLKSHLESDGDALVLAAIEETTTPSSNIAAAPLNDPVSSSESLAVVSVEKMNLPLPSSDVAAQVKPDSADDPLMVVSVDEKVVKATNPSLDLVRAPQSKLENHDDALVRVSVEAEDVDVVPKPSFDDTATELFAGAHSSGAINIKNDEDLLDLSDPTWELDIKRLRDDIDSEIVPVVRRNYNEANPITANISAHKYFKACWPDDDEANPSANSPAKLPKLYLHQWQFPLSETAGRKLCHQNTPLPGDIFGEDLLKYWLDLPQCKGDSCFQYIFLGREDTLSKLHKDPGGLAITIAPIVGEKECVLVHRSDGSTCLYHLLARLDDIDLHRYPLLSQARIWKTVIKPGEILVLPQGTYHQCRNLTTCLSYSRFHLDTVNLFPFLQSMIDGDAPEMQHDEILWNCTTELIKSVDSAVDAAQNCVKAGTTAVPPLDERLVRHVNTLRSLRHIVREIARKLAVRDAVKGNGESPKKKRNEESMAHSRSVLANNAARDWDMLVDDVDLCLHEFRYRRMKTMPKFRKRKVKALTNALIGKGAGSSNQASKYPVVAYNTDLENGYLSLENAPKSSDTKVTPSIEDMSIGDTITIRLQEKQAAAEVLLIEFDKPAAYLTYDEYPALYDEFQPFETLRTLNSGGTGVEMLEDEIKPGCVVTSLEKKGEYRGTVKHIVREAMLKVSIFVSPKCSLERWITMSSVLQTKKRSSQTVEGEPCAEYPSTADDWKMKAETQFGQGEKK